MARPGALLTDQEEPREEKNLLFAPVTMTFSLVLVVRTSLTIRENALMSISARSVLLLLPSLATVPPAAVARTRAGCPVKSGFPAANMVSLQFPATLSSSGLNSLPEPFTDPEKSMVDMILSATKNPFTNQFSSSPLSTSVTSSPVTVIATTVAVREPVPVQQDLLHHGKQVASTDALPRKLDAGIMTMDCSHLVSNDLSPFAQVWVPTSRTVVKNFDLLYPAGINADGIQYEISDDAWVELELGEKSSQNCELPGEASADLQKDSKLIDKKILLPNGSFFIDKTLPPSATIFQENATFPTSYFIDLFNKVRSHGTYNYAGARIKLNHTSINIERFRYYLEDYDDIVICQFLEYGFPIGLAQEIFLEPALKNHQSSYLFYSYLDKFLNKEVSLQGISGPLPTPPFSPTKLSPMMTSPKNPCSRRPVFDASYGDWSLNENTPVKSYMGGNLVIYGRKLCF